MLEKAREGYVDKAELRVSSMYRDITMDLDKKIQKNNVAKSIPASRMLLS